MAQESETREQARPHLRPVPLGPDEDPQVEGPLARQPDAVDGVEVVDPASAAGSAVEPSDPPAGGLAGGRPPRDGSERGPHTGLTPPSRRGGSGRFVTDHLIELGFTTRERVDAAIAESRQSGQTPEQLMLESADITKDQLARAMAERFGLDHVDLNVFEVDLGAVNLIPGQAAKRFEAIPIAFVEEGTLLVAMADPANVRAVDDISIMTGHDVRPAVASAEDIQAVIARASHLEHAVASSSPTATRPTTRRS